MTNTSISLLEKYLGLFLCAVLTAWRKFIRFFNTRHRTNSTTKKIVFVKFIEQGALVLHQNTFKKAAMQYGAENIYLCTFTSNAPLVEVLNLVPATNRIFINEKNIIFFSFGFLQALIVLRKKNVDSAVDLEFFSCASAIFCYLSGAPKRAGYHRYSGAQNYRGNLFTHRLNYSHYVHVADSGWCLLKSLDLPAHNLPALDIGANTAIAQLQFTPSTPDLIRLNALLGFEAQNANPYIVINPNLNDVLPLRQWPAEHYKEFIELFKAQFPGYSFVFTGRADEFDLTNQFIRLLDLKRAVNLCGKTTLTDILTLYSHARLLLTSDSGPGHFASLTSVKTIVLFGPETPVLYGPVNQNISVIYKSLACSPCFNVYNNRQSACQNNLCMQKISAKEVMAAAANILL
jgi:ADP-heptose:LPS heptosyltransferase